MSKRRSNLNQVSAISDLIVCYELLIVLELDDIFIVAACLNILNIESNKILARFRCRNRVEYLCFDPSGNTSNDKIVDLLNYDATENKIDKVDLFYQDSMHFKDGIESEWNLVENYIKQNSYVIFDDLNPHLFCFKQEDAVLHLMKVSAGLDSLVLGEGQILSQVKKMMRLGQENQSTGPILNRLLTQSVSTGKKVKIGRAHV